MIYSPTLAIWQATLCPKSLRTMFIFFFHLTAFLGCSSLDGYFYEHGPFWFDSDSAKSLVANKWSWLHDVHLLFLESPAGVGFSYSDKDYRVFVCAPCIDAHPCSPAQPNWSEESDSTLCNCAPGAVREYMWAGEWCTRHTNVKDTFGRPGTATSLGGNMQMHFGQPIFRKGRALCSAPHDPAQSTPQCTTRHAATPRCTAQRRSHRSTGRGGFVGG